MLETKIMPCLAQGRRQEYKVLPPDHHAIETVNGGTMSLTT